MRVQGLSRPNKVLAHRNVSNPRCLTVAIYTVVNSHVDLPIACYLSLVKLSCNIAAAHTPFVLSQSLSSFLANMPFLPDLQNPGAWKVWIVIAFSTLVFGAWGVRSPYLCTKHLIDRGSSISSSISSRQSRALPLPRKRNTETLNLMEMSRLSRIWLAGKMDMIER